VSLSKLLFVQNHSQENVFTVSFPCKSKSFLYKRFYTRTCFETEAQGNSEICCFVKLKYMDKKFPCMCSSNSMHWTCGEVCSLTALFTILCHRPAVHPNNCSFTATTPFSHNLHQPSYDAMQHCLVPLAVDTWMFATWISNQDPSFNLIFIQLCPEIKVQDFVLQFIRFLKVTRVWFKTCNFYMYIDKSILIKSNG